MECGFSHLSHGGSENLGFFWLRSYDIPPTFPWFSETETRKTFQTVSNHLRLEGRGRNGWWGNPALPALNLTCAEQVGWGSRPRKVFVVWDNNTQCVTENIYLGKTVRLQALCLLLQVKASGGYCCTSGRGRSLPKRELPGCQPCSVSPIADGSSYPLPSAWP